MNAQESNPTNQGTKALLSDRLTALGLRPFIRIYRRLWATFQNFLVFAKTLTGMSALSTLRLLGAPTGSEVKINVAGFSIWVRKGSPDTQVALSCLAWGEFRRLREHLPANFAGLIVDAGGYIGTSALAFSSMFPMATVLTLEPSTANFRILRMNTESNPRIKALSAALVPRTQVGEVALLDPGLGEWGFTTTIENSAGVSVPLETVTGVSLSDIEGGELALFLEEQNQLQAIKVVVAELHDHLVPGCKEAFEALGRNAVTMQGNDEKIWSGLAQ